MTPVEPLIPTSTWGTINTSYICNGTGSGTTYSGYIDNTTPTIERLDVAAQVMEHKKAIERMERELRELRSRRYNDEMEPGMPIEDFLGQSDAQGADIGSET